MSYILWVGMHLAFLQNSMLLKLERIHQIFDEVEKKVQVQIKQILESCGMADVLNIRLNRPIGRKNNLEVWLD